MLHVFWRKSSPFPWFRIDVPKDIRDEVVGLTSRQHSLKTNESALIKSRAAAYTSDIDRLRALKVGRRKADAKVLVHRAFDRMAT